ncbi:2-amino-4-hydroxy-6-hydroxymethyldihydropteridine diphosphokinase [Actinoplanes sp. NBRC 14428]|uniref:2-amino-4-hydroxy-6-hydroxymethyldihydropteridine diphosphokinase n=1 Tax=Pseudosporangium ferrugineum TaxID=439699 RepID=A0A2T0S657_9ACTN|nr:2-amino-4-hydroxy-6-hydroxymethyldihydropteridine diphosphokinase [Pseudosporangium ferrugineum]PRY28899.1 2-amino-4-hydroxy-6-hydroxymethyldihydropteridine diphosphokinase [Pseudosporangium ferrugineum]BCJ53640.1 2-amino-4-hydroxy-6-hydroxymethyldihydropteridine diphosphokinase [Actinoplanes sp. NBRC 14428]
MTRAVLSVGSNLGDRYAHLRTAVEGLGDSVVLVSGVYETPPWGDTEQPPYLNAVVLAVDPAPDHRVWLERVRSLESAAGRVRDPERRFGPRTLDVDVIAVWNDDGTPVTSADAELTLPHPRACERAFVLKPWLDLQPYAQLPGHGWVTDLLNAPGLTADANAMTPRPDLPLEFEG